MATTVLRSPEMDGIAAEIFNLLWGADRPAIPTAVDHAYERIWRKLIAGEWQPGERLSDLDLAAQFRVSRTPVRQALHRLAQNELVLFRSRGGGSRSAGSPTQDVHEMYDVRAALESLAVSLAVPDVRCSRSYACNFATVPGSGRQSAGDEVLPFLQHDFRVPQPPYSSIGQRAAGADAGDAPRPGERLSDPGHRLSPADGSGP